MIKSMTGFGSVVKNHPQLGEVSIDVRSLNNRFLDFSVRLPREFNAMEPRLREDVKKRLRRGKVDMYIRYVPAPDAQALYNVNAPALRHYAAQVNEAFGAAAGAQVDLGALLQLPGVVNPAPAVSEDGPLVQLVSDAVQDALNALENVRAVEGKALVEAIKDHLDIMQQLRGEVEQEKDELLADYRQRLKERIEVFGKTLDATLDPIRVETEIMFFADKSDITEELVRLDAHIKSFRAMVVRDTGEPVGKAMDFLVQELLRETNTIGNKARGVSVASKIVAMKSEIEKIREQVQNLE